jgi:TolB-like protein
MQARVMSGLLVAAVLLTGGTPRAGAQEKDKAPAVHPLALFSFEERGAAVKDFGAKVSDILFAKLATRPELNLVDRSEMKKLLEEQELNLSGAVKPGEATKVGQLTGAKILITGSIVQADKKVYLIAKIIGTETSRVLGASTSGKLADELAPLVEELGDKIADTIEKQSDKLLPAATSITDRLAALQKKLKPGARPTVLVQIRERHIGAPLPDPAAQTEVMLFCKQTGFEVLDPEEGLKSRADILITGEGLSEAATRRGNLHSVKARVEIQAIDRKTGKVIAADRQTAIVVDLSENLAGKAALQEAAAVLAERLLPKLVGQ